MPTESATRIPALSPRATVSFLLSLGLLLAGGCAGVAQRAESPGLAGSRDLQAAVAVRAAQAAAEAESARLEAVRTQSAGEPRYLRFRADETGLTAARDDGDLTYLEFAAAVGTGTEFFDQNGRALRTAAAGRVAAIEGLHAGILVRRADRASFVSPNPRAFSLPRQALPDSPDHAEARAMLQSQGDQLQAMQRAMEAARSGSAQGRHGSVAPAAPLAPIHFPRFGVAAAPPEPIASVPSGVVMPRPAPLAMAGPSTSAPERGLVRIFFATASRAIVAPDDGLGLLLREAANADEIRVTGFTDATGSHATNDALALARADAVVRILLRRGIPAERIFSSAVGAAGFIADNASEKGRALNRRVEVLMLRNGVPITSSAVPRSPAS